MADEPAGSGSPSAASSAGEPLLPPDNGTSDSPAEDVVPLTPLQLPEHQFHAPGRDSAAEDDPAEVGGAAYISSGDHEIEHAGGGRGGVAEHREPGSLSAAVGVHDGSPGDSTEAAGGCGGSMHDTAVHMPLYGSLHSPGSTHSGPYQSRGIDAAAAGGQGDMLQRHMHGAHACGPREGAAAADGGAEYGPATALLAQRVSFYRQAWRYYGEHLGIKELHPWATLVVLLAGMAGLAGLSNSYGGRGGRGAGARVQVAACCCAACCVLTALYFRMAKLQLANRDFAVQCANASVVALQQTMHEMHRLGAARRAGGRLGPADLVRGQWRDKNPPRSQCGSADGDHPHACTGEDEKEAPLSSQGADSATAAAAYGRSPPRMHGSHAYVRGDGIADGGHMHAHHDAIWAGFVGKLRRSMRAGAAEHPVALQALFNWLGAVVCVGGIFGAALPVDVGAFGHDLPVVSFAGAVVVVGAAWAAVNCGGWQ